MASWTSALTGFVGGAANVATTSSSSDSTPSALSRTNDAALANLQCQPHTTEVSWAPPLGIEHIITPHVHINVPQTPGTAATDLV